MKIWHSFILVFSYAFIAFFTTNLIAYQDREDNGHELFLELNSLYEYSTVAPSKNQKEVEVTITVIGRFNSHHKQVFSDLVEDYAATIDYDDADKTVMMNHIVMTMLRSDYDVTNIRLNSRGK